jgi:hypothetical protein
MGTDTSGMMLYTMPRLMLNYEVLAKDMFQHIFINCPEKQYFLQGNIPHDTRIMTQLDMITITEALSNE